MQKFKKKPVTLIVRHPFTKRIAVVIWNRIQTHRRRTDHNLTRCPKINQTFLLKQKKQRSPKREKKGICFKAI